MTAADVTIEPSAEGTGVALAGALVLATVDAAAARLAALGEGSGPVRLDLSGVESLDTAGAWLVVTLAARLEADGVPAEITGASETHALLIETVRASLPPPEPPAPARRFDPLARLGEAVAVGAGQALEFFSFLGIVVVRLAGTALRPRRFRAVSFVHHLQEAGLSAVPIVVLMSFLIGIVLAYQGALQLRQFGAEIFVVDLIGIAVLRELGVLLTAIIVAGRSASAFTASIGSMKMREEIDAMRTIGLDPIDVLVLPRLLALLVGLPILGFIGSIAGLVGGGLMSYFELGISPITFASRLRESTDVSHFLIGMSKAPFFALIIGLVGCLQGLRVEANAESLGRQTTRAVVQAIFLVIVVNAVFSIFYAVVGL